MLLHAHPWPIKEYCHNQCVCVCVCRSRSVGVYCVTGGWFSSAIGPGCWEFDVLYQKKTTSKEVQEEVIYLFQPLFTMYIEPL